MNRQQFNQWQRGLGALVECIVQTRQINAATGKVVSESAPVKNLIMDGALNALARSTNASYPAEMAAACRVGDGSTADKVSSGAVTFTQAGTTLTASAGFFTAGMVGWIFKYGTGTAGAEYYITAFTSSTVVTVDTSDTVGTPTVGTVWNVARTTLVNLLFTHSTYETTAGSCQSTFTANVAEHKRTYNFAQQGASYNVNEIGYFRVTTGTTIFGRIVLGATEVVAPTNFLQVVLTISVTYTPSNPTAVANVGTNIDTAGNAMIENIGGGVVSSTGPATAGAAGFGFDGSANIGIRGAIATYTQNATVGAASVAITSVLFQSGLSWAFASPVVRGKMTVAANATISTSGQTLFGVVLGGTSSGAASLFDVKFTTTFTLPTGSFLPQVTFSCIYNRTLNN